MYSTKAYDDEEHRLEHMLRHARLLDAVASHDDIEPIGESPVMLRGGMGGLYIRTKGSVGRASVTLSAEGCESVTLGFNISAI